jgi:serine O-acetyltransferase
MKILQLLLETMFISVHMSVVENVHIGNNSTIGAGAVITRDIPENATVAGVPAKVLNYDNPGRYVGFRYKP